MFAHRESVNLFKALTFVGNCEVKDVLRKLDEVSILSHKVCFTLEGNDGREIVCALHEHAPFSSFTVATLGSNSLPLLANDFSSLFEVALSFGKSLFAVTKTGAGHSTEFLDIF